MERCAEQLFREFIEQAQVDGTINAKDELLDILVTGFETNPGQAQREMRRLSESEPRSFISSAFRVLKAAPEGSGQVYLRELLWENDGGIACLSEPTLFPLDRAVQLARNWARVEPTLSLKLLQLIFADERQQGGVDIARTRRILEIVGALPPHTGILPLLMKLLRSPDERLHSKATALFCRASKSADWARKKLDEPDPRVRANAVEGLWEMDSRSVISVLQQAALDSDHRVVANALIGMYPLNRDQAGKSMRDMAAHPRALFRAAGAFAMGQTLNPEFSPPLEAMVKDADAKVRSHALRALMRIRKNQRATA